MSFDLAAADLRAAATRRPWQRPDYWLRLSEATSEYRAPLIALGLEALSYNAHELLRRAQGTPIRVATKSIRIREVLNAVLALPGYRGVLAYTLAEALWLSETIDDVLVAYPSTDRDALNALASNEQALDRVTLMIDSLAHLEFIERSIKQQLPRAARPSTPIRVCLDFDASWRTPILGKLGALRSPVHSVTELRQLAEQVMQRPGFSLVGLMSYEAQIAGVADRPRRQPMRGVLLREMQRRSAAELAERRAQAVAAVRAIADLAFVNGGGTGSIERTVAEEAVTEVAAGSGLFGPHLFDHYRAFTPAPALTFALDVVRKADRRSATLLGGGWVASGVHGSDRLPLPCWPRGLRLTTREGAGEVQTPVRGRAAARLRVGDRVWFRHAKSGEPLEHAAEVVALAVTDPRGSLTAMRSYRGEGKCFL